MLDLQVGRIPGPLEWRHLLPVWAGTTFIKSRCECGGRVKRRHIVGVCVYTRRGGYLLQSRRLIRRHIGP